MKNRRNYYRILQVQPDAPVEVIRSSYRTLMQTLKAHPDLGGDTELAAVINDAYATLSDPTKRKAYDEKIKSEYGIDALSGFPNNGAAIPVLCPFCGHPTAQHVTQHELPHCARCNCPLSPPQNMQNSTRKMHRIVLDAPIMVQSQYYRHAIMAGLRDWSPSGLAIITEHPCLKGQILSFGCAYFNAVGEVKYCRPIATHPTTYQIGAQFLTLSLPLDRGNFIDKSI